MIPVISSVQKPPKRDAMNKIKHSLPILRHLYVLSSSELLRCMPIYNRLEDYSRVTTAIQPSKRDAMNKVKHSLPILRHP